MLPITAILLMPLGAQAIPFGTYELGNHPDGGKAEPFYGLRLDKLVGGSGVWTFDFDHDQSAMYLNYDSNGINIFGSVYGGKDIGSGYDDSTTALWKIDFFYSANGSGTSISEHANGGLVDTKIFSNHENRGTITNLTPIFDLAANSTFDLRDHGKEKIGPDLGLALQLGDEGGSGHRKFRGISGWGWLDHRAYSDSDWPDSTRAPSDNGCCSDWLFTAQKVPEPGSLSLVGLGLIAARFAKRQKRTT